MKTELNNIEKKTSLTYHNSHIGKCARQFRKQDYKISFRTQNKIIQRIGPKSNSTVIAYLPDLKNKM